MLLTRYLGSLTFLLASAVLFAQQEKASIAPRSPAYRALQSRLAQGWNTWDTNSVTTQVLLPDGLAIRLLFRHDTHEHGDQLLEGALIGRKKATDEKVFPGPHAWDGSYTSLTLTWHGKSFRVQSAHDGDDLVELVTPAVSASEGTQDVPGTLILEAGYLWNRNGTVVMAGDHMEASSPAHRVSIYFAGTDAHNQDLALYGHYFSASLTQPLGISTGHRRTVDEIRTVLDRQERIYRTSVSQPAKTEAVQDAIQTTIGWDTIYDSANDRVISPVSRLWNVTWGQYVLFGWDTFFAGSLAAIGDRDLAYANTIEILREETPAGFVPNYARSGGWRSTDRSEPPVGAISVLGLYHKFHDRWLLEDTFEPLMRWNRWWAERRDVNGYLVWGSDPEPGRPGQGTRQAAIYESGLDNSPMYDDAFFDTEKHKLMLGDVGLMSLYIADCGTLAEIADTLNKPKEAKELRERAVRYRAKLFTMWDDKAGIFLNRDLKTGTPSHRLSPTNFYPMLARTATKAQADRMLKEHLLNPEEFWGKWIMPSIARNDPAYKDQNYWRGRVWGPMNYLVYLGLRNYDVPQARAEFADKSLGLFQKEWREKGHVHENYNADTGEGDDKPNSDAFYHWGALLGLPEWMENDAPVQNHSVNQ